MFAILLMNTFAPITDHYVRQIKAARKASKQARSNPQDAGEGS